ncbi:MAG: arginase [Proteobacteria bacterium]|nr:arginase [Pseudomonadota bacterium]
MPRKFNSVRIIGVPSDLGANIRGANVGPSAVRIAGLHDKISVLGYKIEDAGDILVPIRETLPESAAKEKYLTTITDVCDLLRMEVEMSLDRDMLPIVIGGDHSIAMGTISGTSSFYRKKNQSIGLIWVDAHADMNTPASSPTGNLHGMPLSTLLGKGIPQLVELGGFAEKLRPENVALIGIRTLDHEEKRICRESGIRYFTMREIDERGMAAIMKEAVAVASKGTSGIHLSFDVDGIDPLYAPGVSTPVTGGLSYREAHLALEMIADTGMLTSMEFVELNPMRDVAHKTAELLVELVQSALGKSIV